MHICNRLLTQINLIIMMKNYLLVLFLLIAGSKMSAQYGYWGWCGDCYYSIEVGMGVSNISGIESASAKTGFYAGLYSFIPIDYDKFDIRTGMSYTSVGAEIADFKNPLVIHSINFPLTLHYRPTPMFQVFGGGEIGSNLFGRPASNADNPNSVDDDWFFFDSFTMLDAGILVGGGIILFDGLDISASYSLGMTNISKLESQDWKKNIFRLSVAYTFRDW